MPQHSLIAATLLAASIATAQAAEPAACKTVNFAEVGWADIAATTGLATTVLQGLGYQTKTQMLSIPVAYQAMEMNNIDVYLGAWMPSMAVIAKPFLDSGKVERVRTNLVGAKYTLAVPDYAYDAGLKDFKDIASFREPLQGRLYGIEAGNDGNQIIQGMIDKDAHGLKGFRLVDSSEAGMLVEVRRAVRARKPIVFLAWEPHPMNTQLSMRYLSGGDAEFGPDYGAAVVDTHTRKGYGAQCPNVAMLLKQLEFQLGMENQIMGAILNDKQKPALASREWLVRNPQVLDGWLAGVTTFDGQPGVPAVRRYLGL
ncbi:choline ABC transporter substrate-binding protein [Pseudomonas entomophila]|uniref:choline ABC transporter substrate-binding protein n=1 Tax=Pseudomonas entomophila TaxID=312306 RepID=UPI0023D7F8BF|nr:choline ABC transporter substrate-binding protein [Pseudomonas entomophila]MDF0731377.1 choline ABC transporter substrate-binding protein [Pseudomonas entomophila]